MNASIAPALPQAPATTSPRYRPPRLRDTAPPLLLIANANASGIAGRRAVVDGAADLLRGRGARVDVRVTSSLDELESVVRGEERRLALLGGDGSLHAVANVSGAKPDLALLPAGRANNVAHALGVPSDLAAAAALAVAGGTRPLDAIAVRTAGRRQIAVEGVSVGFHAVARAGYHGTNSGDTLAGIATGLRALARFEPTSVAIDSDGRLEFRRVAQLFVANLPLYGPRLHVAPAADATDGELDVVEIGPLSRAALIPMLARLRRGTHVDHPAVRIWRARRIRIATGGRSPIIADTTTITDGTAELEVVRGALSVVAAA